MPSCPDAARRSRGCGTPFGGRRCGEQEPRLPSGTLVGGCGAHRRATRVGGRICLVLLLLYHYRCRRGSQVVVRSLGGAAAPGNAGYDEEQGKGSPTQCAPTWASPVVTTPSSLLMPTAVRGSWPLLLAPFGNTTDGRTAAAAAVVDPGGRSCCTGWATPPSPQPSQVAGVVCSVEIQRRDMACGATASIRNRKRGLFVSVDARGRNPWWLVAAGGFDAWKFW
ncbi:unnamed protein product [Urochloa humidicola]